MKLTFGTARYETSHRVAILDEDGKPVQVIGPRFLDHEPAEQMAELLNHGKMLWVGMRLVWNAALYVIVVAGLLAPWIVA